MRIRPATSLDLAEVLRVEREAFGGDEEAELVEALLADPTARPFISLLAEDGGRGAGHVLLTSASVEDTDVLLMLLAPLAVAPEYQAQGVGGALTVNALNAAAEAGAVAVLVLGHIGYYPRFGFEPAGPHGFRAPYPIPDEVADAWMVAELVPGTLGTLSGSVRVARALMKPGLWRE
jgi:putative acetyltransferase